jgi:hypothetical protein
MQPQNDGLPRCFEHGWCCGPLRSPLDIGDLLGSRAWSLLGMKEDRTEYYVPAEYTRELCSGLPSPQLEEKCKHKHLVRPLTEHVCYYYKSIS